MRPVPDPVKPGQRSVWDFPRPPIVQPTAAHLRVVFAGRTIAETRRGVEVLETSHPPTYYFPRDDVDATVLAATPRRTICEWKGQGAYFDVVVGSERADDAAWSYPTPTPRGALLAGFLAFYPALMEACIVDGEVARPQPGGFYGGWITSDLAGPFKGEPGTRFW